MVRDADRSWIAVNHSSTWAYSDCGEFESWRMNCSGQTWKQEAGDQGEGCCKEARQLIVVWTRVGTAKIERND